MAAPMRIARSHGGRVVVLVGSAPSLALTSSDADTLRQALNHLHDHPELGGVEVLAGGGWVAVERGGRRS